MIERKIVIGLIISTDYVKQIRGLWNPQLIQSSSALQLAGWALEFFDKYNAAPGKAIETIFYKKVKEGLQKDLAEEIEEELLPGLSEEYENSEFNVDHLVDETVLYFKEQSLLLFSSSISSTIENGQGNMTERIKVAEQLIHSFTPVSGHVDDSITLGSDESIKRAIKAFVEAGDPVIIFPKALGAFWNEQFVPGAFISLLAPEKRGKTFWLLEFAMRAVKQRKKVAFFQAGDMNESDQLKRIGIYLVKKSNLEKYCTEHYEPVVDCIFNQMDSCDKKERECEFGIFDTKTEEQVRKEIHMKDLIEAYKENKDYAPCYNCKEFTKNKWGVPWIKYVPKQSPLNVKEIEIAFASTFNKNADSFKLSTHANSTLTVSAIDAILDRWNREEDFVPDVILIDYADILACSERVEFRHQQNHIWKELRKLSQTKRRGILPLVICPTQADANSYSSHRLGLKNFSEDKRKYGHVTAMFGLNQDPGGREKEIGIMRINKIIIREGESSPHDEVIVLQNLRRGRPFLQSYL